MTYYRRTSGQQGGRRRTQLPGSRRGRTRGGLLIALVIAAVALFRYCSSADYNEVTGETQYVAITEDQEIALGLQSTPQMVRQYGGISRSAEGNALVSGVGERLVRNSDAGKTPYQFDFHLLADRRTVNAFALPGGQVFITEALLGRLTTEDQLAGVLGHEIGHVIARHGAERIAKEQLSQGLTGAAVVASGDYETAAAAAMIANLVNMSYGRDQELQSDDLGVRFMYQAGYDPRGLLDVMAILEEASGGQSKAEFFSTHPSYDNRLETIQRAIDKYAGQN